MMSEIQKYSGTWKLFEKEKLYQGELHISHDNRIIALELHLPASEKVPMPRSPYKGKIPFICGTLISGAKILLYDCSTGAERIHVASYAQQTIYANYAFWGLNVKAEDEIKFTKATFDFGEINEWTGLCRYEWSIADEGGMNLTWFHRAPVTFELSENLKIKFKPSQGSIGGDMYGKEIKANQHSLVDFEYKNMTTWDTIMEDALCIQYLIGLGVSQKVEIDKAQFCHPLVYSEFSKGDGASEKLHIAAEVTIGAGNVNPTQKTKRYECLYTLEDLKEIDAFDKWRVHYSMLKPVLDLYFSGYSRTAGTPEMLFLNLIQALETYHARFITDKAKTYVDRVNALVDSFCQGNKNSEQWRTFLLDEGQMKNTKSLYLRSRLADLVFANGNLPFQPHRLPIDAYVQKIVDTRNYYTHYNPIKRESAFTRVELTWVNGHLLTLLEYHLLVLMGFDVGEVRKKTIEKIDQIDDAYQIQMKINDTER